MRPGLIAYDFFSLIIGIGRHTYTMYCELKPAILFQYTPS